MKTRRFTIAVLALILLAASLFAIASPRKIIKRGLARIERSWLILTGGLVDVGGYRLRTEGSGRGQPAVIMDAGLYQTMKTWGSVPSEVSAFARVIIYDRAGLGESDRRSKPRTSKQIAKELRTLLTNAGVAPPYVLVGHSFGGLNMRLFASMYPYEVVGLVLVDAAHEDERDRYRPLFPQSIQEKYLIEDKENYEGVDLVASAEQVRTAAPLRPLPLAVLSAPANAPPGSLVAQMEKAKREMQADLARLVPNSKHIFLEDSGHFIQIDRPDAVVDAIREVVEAARQQSPALSP